MKKLTAGIFAGILTIVTVNAADAAITSKAYVDGLVGANTTEINTLKTNVSKNTTDITALQEAVGDLAGDGTGSVADQIAEALGEIPADSDVATELDKKQDKSSKAYSMGNAQGGWTALEEGEVAALTSGITSDEVKQITTNKTDIATMDAAYKAADKAITDKIGTVTEGTTVVGMIEAVQTAAAGDVDEKLGNLGEGNETVADALDKKQDTLGATNVTTDGNGNALASVKAEDGTVTFQTINAVTVPVSNESTEAGTYVLTATIAGDGTKTYMWESIERTAPATQE